MFNSLSAMHAALGTPRRPDTPHRALPGAQVLPCARKPDGQRDEIGAIPRVGQRHQLCVRWEP